MASWIAAKAAPWSLRLSSVLLLLLNIAGCNNDSTAPDAPPAGNVSAESANRAVATIGASGGTVSTTDTQGVSYTLDVLAGALPGDVEIALTPVRSIQDLPFPGEMLAAVHLEPSGLTLLKPAVLTIGTAATLTDSQVLTGFSYEGDATSAELTGAIATGNTMQVLVEHFSGAGAAGIDHDPIQEICAGPTLEMSFGWQLVVCIGPYPENSARFLEFAADYADQIVTPALNGALGLTLADAVIEYLAWYLTCDHYAAAFHALDWEIVLDARITALRILIGQKLREAIVAEKAALCGTTGGMENLRAVFQYRELADAMGLLAEPGFTDEDVLDGLCAEIEIEEASLIEPLPVGSDHSLDVRAALLINGQRVDAGFEFLINGSENLRCEGALPPCGGRSNGLGEFTTVVRRVDQGGVAINILANLLLPLFVPEEGGGFALKKTPLQGYRLVLRSGAAIETTFPAFVVPGEPATLAVRVVEFEVVGPATPIPFAVVTVTADGATVDPGQTIADEDGRAEVTVTAQEGARDVTVNITAAVDGVDVATRQVVATVGDVTIVLTRHQARASAGAGSLSPDCPYEFVREDRLDQGSVDGLTATIERSCSIPGATGSVFASTIHNSDPGIAADLRSATLTISNSGTGIAAVEPDDVAFLKFVVQGFATIQFTIQGGPVAFEIEAEVDLANVGDTNAISSSISLARWSNPGETVFEFNRTVGDGQPDQMVAGGILAPGSYAVHCSISGASDDTGGPADHSLSAFNRVTLRLNSTAPAVASGGPSLATGDKP